MQGEKGNQGQINLTLSKYYRITGSSTQNIGVKPDVMLPSIFDRQDLSEASERAALPWDEIKPANFESSKDINPKIIDKLRKSYEKRLKTDTDLKELIQNVEDLKKLRKNTKISLNEAKRKIEIEEYEKKQKEKADLETDENEETLKSEDNPSPKAEKKDLYLQNAMQVLVELIQK